MSTNAIFKGDDTGAFGIDFITIELENPLGNEISKAIFVCGCIQKPFKNPQFPLIVNFDSKETKQLRIGNQNVCYLVVYDAQGRQKTCQGTLVFGAKDGVLNNGGCNC